jgi:two-component system chemotaxis sensor kinase CheA
MKNDQSHHLALAEIEERVEQIFAAIEELHAKDLEGKSRREVLDSIFRLVHSVKGSASASGLNRLARLAHEFEGLLHSLRIGRTALNEKVLRAFAETAQSLLDSLGASGSGNQAGDDDLIGRLQQLSESVTHGQAGLETVLNALPSAIRHSLSEEEKHHLEESFDEGARLYLVTADFDVTDFDRQFQLLKQRLAETGEVISTAPKVDNDRPEKINFRILYTRAAALQQVKDDLAEQPDVSVTEVLSPPTLVNTAVDSQPGIVIDDEARSRESLQTAAKQTSNLIRIDLEDLDRLISLTHKLFRETTMFQDRALDNLSAGPSQAELEAMAARVSRSFIELAAETISLRMVSIDRVLQRAVRSGRAAALAAGKQIDFVITGSDLLLDKSLSDAIADPLIHLVRNAVDHGIESVRERTRVGKSERGTVRIESATTQGQTRVQVTDDGRGIDPSAVSKVAISLGVIEEASLPNMDQSLRLIFWPGLSTAGSISGTSGRGVGLDVVETAVEEVGGEVRVASKPGAGSSFEIRLPVTFGLLEVVLVTSSNRQYLLDKSHILFSKTVGAREVEATGTGKVFRHNNELLPLVRLSELLGQSSEAIESEELSLLLCQFSKEAADGTNSLDRVGVVVDAVGETQQVLIRNLGSRGARWFGVAGAAELRDGRVALLLDLPRLINANA